MDCSDLVQDFFITYYNIDVGGSVEIIYQINRNRLIKDKSDLRTGDILIFQSNEGYPYHVGIYDDRYNGMLHVSSKRGVEILKDVFNNKHWGLFKWLGLDFELKNDTIEKSCGAVRVSTP